MRSPIVEQITELLNKKPSRRNFLAGVGAAGAASLVAGCGHSGTVTPPPPVTNPTLMDSDYLTFALNLEYLEAEFYLRAATGTGLSAADNSSTGNAAGSVTGGTQVPFKTTVIQQYAIEIAQNELNHVRFLRSALTMAGITPVSAPALDFTNAFTAAATAAGITGPFNPFADENSFLLGAFVFEDVGVTAYTGAAPLLTTKAYLSAAAGIQAVEAYHAAEIRTIITAVGGPTAIAAANMISALRGKLGGGAETALSAGSLTMASTIVAADSMALAYARTPDEVLHIVYATGGGAGVKSGGFFPSGLNGNITATAS